MKKALILGIALSLALACKKETEEKAKDAINEGGKAVQETAGKVVDEVSSHFEDSRGCKLELSEDLKNKGIGTGKFYIEKDTVTKKYNKLVIYLINDKSYKGAINFKVLDKKGVEVGRTTLEADAKTGYKDILFDNRTDIEPKSTISIY
jgi:CTP-dependent riboflavin kinase